MCIDAFSIHLAKPRDPQPSSAKLSLPIIPIGIVCRVRVYAVVRQPLSKQFYTYVTIIPRTCLGYEMVDNQLDPVGLLVIIISYPTSASGI